MKRLDGIRATGNQKLSTTIDNGDSIYLTIYFNPAIQIWKTDLEWKNFFLNGYRLCSHPNLLIQYENLLPFGLAVTTNDNGDPFLINDFSSGRSNMYILSLDEVKQVNQFFTDQKEE